MSAWITAQIPSRIAELAKYDSDTPVVCQLLIYCGNNTSPRQKKKA